MDKTMSHVVYCELLKGKLIPAIIAKWPPGDRDTRNIEIRQDGAKAHILNNDPEFLKILVEKGSNTEMNMQLVNSPDTNLLDFLGHSIKN